MPSITEPHNEVLDVHQVARRLEAALPKKIHPETGTGIERFGYSGFKRKFLFFNLDSPSMPNTGLQIVFRCAAKKQCWVEYARKSRLFKGLNSIVAWARAMRLCFLHCNSCFKIGSSASVQGRA
jgi:hypothetical protein